MAISVTTRSYDKTRSGANTREGALTPDAVGTRGIRRLYSINLPGDKRGVEAQPLVVADVTLPDGTKREIVYLATMANRVSAFDVADGTLIWTRTLGRPVDGIHDIDSHDINDHWGVLSTPVIDQATHTMYVAAWISDNGSVGHAHHFAYALRITDGSDANPPLNLEGARFDPGHGLPHIDFLSAPRKQRASLLLTSIGGVSTVFIGFGSVKETSDTSRGWVIAVGTAPFAITAAWASTAKGHGAGIWQAGAGLAADADGSLYAMTGNGDFDAATDWGESFVKLTYTPPATGQSASLRVVDWWTPYTDDARTGAAHHAIANTAPAPTNLRRYAVAAAGNEGKAAAEWGDMDLGSGGPVLIPSLGLVVGAGKDGVLYVLDRTAMGKTRPADLPHPATNYAKLKSPPIFFTYFPPNLKPGPDDITTLNVLFAGRTHHLHGNPLYWDSPDHGPMLFCWGENENLRAWSVAPGGAVTFLAHGAEQASAQSNVPPGGMPGGMLTLSANGSKAHSGVIWALIPYADANIQWSAGRLLAYDATHFDSFPDGSKRLRVLWDSQDWNIQFTFNKFNVPVVANGRLFVPTYDARVDVYGL
jgi:hypothetical protein